MTSYPYYLANVAETPNTDLAVTDKYTGDVAYRVALADAHAIDRAIGAAVEAAEPMRHVPPYERQSVLMHCVGAFEERTDELALSLCVEAGKPIKDARGEVTRLIDTFRIAAEESVRMNGEVMNLEISPRARGYRGMFMRVPIGACSFISPFIFPAQSRHSQRPLRRRRPIRQTAAPSRRVATQLSRDSRRGSPEPTGHVTHPGALSSQGSEPIGAPS